MAGLFPVPEAPVAKTTNDPLTPLRALANNAWNWDLTRFADVLGLDKTTQYTKDLFKDFQELNRLVGRFDEAALTKLCTRG